MSTLLALAVHYLTEVEKPTVGLLVVKCGHTVALVSIGGLLPKSTTHLFDRMMAVLSSEDSMDGKGYL